MNIYVLRRDCEGGTDEYDGFVIVATGPRMARRMANAHCGDEGHVWHDTDNVTCEWIGTTLDLNPSPHIVLGSFMAG